MIDLEKARLIEQFMGTENGPDFIIYYISDWNWLMKALRKFDYLYDDNHYVAKDFYREYCDHCDDIDATLTTHDITDTVNALCDGIEWYNSTIN